MLLDIVIFACKSTISSFLTYQAKDCLILGDEYNRALWLPLLASLTLEYTYFPSFLFLTLEVLILSLSFFVRFSIRIAIHLDSAH